MKFWYKVNKLRYRIGEITDYYGLYVELKDFETGNYVIVHWSKIEPAASEFKDFDNQIKFKL